MMLIQTSSWFCADLWKKNPQVHEILNIISPSIVRAERLSQSASSDGRTSPSAQPIGAEAALALRASSSESLDLEVIDTRSRWSCFIISHNLFSWADKVCFLAPCKVDPEPPCLCGGPSPTTACWFLVLHVEYLWFWAVSSILTWALSATLERIWSLSNPDWVRALNSLRKLLQRSRIP